MTFNGAGHLRLPRYTPQSRHDRLEQEPKSPVGTRARSVVGTGRVELPTYRLGGGCSIQLSYVPTPGATTLIVARYGQRFSPLRPMSRRICIPSKWIFSQAA